MPVSASTLVAGGVLFTAALLSTSVQVASAAAFGVNEDSKSVAVVEDNLDGDAIESSGENQKNVEGAQNRHHGMGRRRHRRHNSDHGSAASDSDASQKGGEAPPPLKARRGHHNANNNVGRHAAPLSVAADAKKVMEPLANLNPLAAGLPQPVRHHKHRTDDRKSALDSTAEVDEAKKGTKGGDDRRQHHRANGHQHHDNKKEKLGGTANKRFDVSFERILQSPILTNAFSTSTYNYNSAYVPHVGTDSHDTFPRDCLAVRVQNYTAGLAAAARSSLSPSALLSHAKNYLNGNSGSDAQKPQEPHLGVGYIGPSSISIICEDSYDYPFAKENTWIVLQPSQADYQALGTEDPRVVHLKTSIETEELKSRRAALAESSSPNPPLTLKDGTLLMYYTAVNNKTSDGHVTAVLALALCHLSVDPHCTNWELRGPILPDRAWSKSGAMLIVPDRADPPTDNKTSAAPPVHYLLFGDSDIFVATTTDFLTYNDTGSTLMTTRADPFFDSNLIEAGPPPELLSDNESFIFLYNSARNVDIPNPDPNWKLQYNLGFAILALPTDNTAGAIPSVVQRADLPILSPELGWETCNNASGVPGLTADVVFVEGMKRLRRSRSNKSGTDLFLVYYQGADARMGVGLLTVDIIED
eukprot:GILI01006296.1.p1 GENE.GILI01006296.1~~GILI01006296.1.p1  ORF type:complete len:653 (-),score=146.04 GILI01006296.1:288-2213(-)